MRADALAQVRALADVERQCIEPVEKINAGRFRQRVDRIGGELGRQTRRPEDTPGSLLDRVGGEIAVERAYERPEHPGIAERAMPPVEWKPVAGDHAVQVVPRLVGEE